MMPKREDFHIDIGKLVVIYRDELGVVSVEAPDLYYLEGKLYFTDTEGKDYIIPVENLISAHALYNHLEV